MGSRAGLYVFVSLRYCLYNTRHKNVLECEEYECLCEYSLSSDVNVFLSASSLSSVKYGYTQHYLLSIAMGEDP